MWKTWTWASTIANYTSEIYWKALDGKAERITQVQNAIVKKFSTAIFDNTSGKDAGNRLVSNSYW